MTRLIVAVFMVVVGLVAPCAAGTNDDGKKPSPWTDYLGTQDKVVDWARTVRGLGRGETGKGGEGVTALAAKLGALGVGHEAIVPVGGLDSARDPDKVKAFMDMVKGDGARSWKKAVHDQAVALGRLPSDSTRVFWQIGNEINSKHYAQHLCGWSGGYHLLPDSECIIPLYVEYYFAPAAEALMGASKELHGTETAIPIMLGSLAGANRPKSQEWLDTLLHYRIKGDWAPGLKGKRVFEVVNIISLHYLATAGDDRWSSLLDRLYGTWVKGGLKGVWATEEIGFERAKHGLGAATALKVAARYLSYYQARGISPQGGRFNLWGWDKGAAGTTGKDGMQALYAYLGAVPLEAVPGVGIEDAGGDLEIHGFKSEATPARYALIIVPHSSKQKRIFSVAGVNLPFKSDAIRATAHIFSPQGHRVAEVSLNKGNGDRYALVAPGGPLTDASALLLLFAL